MPKIKVSYALELDDKDFKKVLGAAENQGHSYGDAGPIETVRRLLISEGTEIVEFTIPGIQLKYEVHKD